VDFLEEFKMLMGSQRGGLQVDVGSYGSCLCAEVSGAAGPVAGVFLPVRQPSPPRCLQPKVGARAESLGALLAGHRLALPEPLCNWKTGCSCPQAKGNRQKISDVVSCIR